ncbi:MAG: SRPBCC family protein [Phycisphaerales bacterium]|nr:SRPBCC family protein [Phycisphaerales bacterium]
MTLSETPGLGFETVVEIAAPVADVWRAITDEEEITRWFPLHARDTRTGGANFSIMGGILRG